MLEAVCDTITAAAPALIVDLGDLVSGAFDPAGGAEPQMRSGDRTTASNHADRLQDGSRGTFGAPARPLLRLEHWAWIGALPATLTRCERDVLACPCCPWT